MRSQQVIPLDRRVLKETLYQSRWVEVLAILDHAQVVSDEMLSPAKVLSLLSGHFPDDRCSLLT